ncbi:lysylphosphatidylglycerol synthase transmembrane domain-containing protein [Sphingobium sp. DC-2]|uniref:lysylphosphatidylglycerol synthase transmembrane domain-containing protein n=1 Tax=Sphingobium sp. DC-2 TaxID=1303256 RepID=UPI0004C2C929|nr:lysylphosphatidylglycerol synthase transmembrane domain-containing protein [Sphingobium sp. DC-2]
MLYRRAMLFNPSCRNRASSHCFAWFDRGRRIARRLAFRYALHSIIGLLFLALFLRQIDLGGVIAIARQVWVAPLVIALLAYAMDFLLRAVRFWMVLESVSGRRLPFRRVPGPFVASFGISDLLPLRAGDVFRLLWFQRQMALPASGVLGAMMVERFLDLATLLLLAVAVAGWHLDGHWLFYLALLAGGCIATPMLTAAAGRWARRSRTMRWAWIRGLVSALDTFRILRSPGLAVSVTGLSLAAWLLEAAVLLGAWISLGGAAEAWAAPMAAFVTSTLGTLFPGLPGHFGTFELFGLEMFARVGVAPDFAAAVLLLAHLMLWAPTALFAIGWLPFSRSRQAAH